jgi:iron(III) transport system substrate-binding protein
MRSKQRSLFAAVAALALVVSACGSDDDDAAAPPAAEVEEPAVEEPAVEEPAVEEPAAEEPAAEEPAAEEPAAEEPAAEEPAAEEGMTPDGVVVQMDGEDYDSYIARLYVAASDEGQVIYYQSSGESELEFIREQWEALYPDVDFEPVTARAGTILERALLEVGTGNTQGDVFGAAGVEMLLLEQEDALADYSPAGLEFVSADFIFDGPYIGLNYLSRHVTYNTDNVDPADLPSDWFGYCDPEWKGRIGIDAESFEWAAAFIQAWGEEEARKFLECINANEPVLHRGTTNGTELVNVGEFDVKLDGMGHVSKRFIDGEASIGVQIPHPSPMPAIVDMSAILANSPNPNSAQLLQEFWLQPEGQIAMTNEGKATTTSTEGEHPYWSFMEGADLLVLGPRESVALEAGLVMFSDIF